MNNRLLLGKALSAVSTTLLIWPLISVPVLAQQASSSAPFDNFTKDSSLQSWKERSFKGNTHYQLVEEQGFRVLKAQSNAQASVLYHESMVDLRKTPIIKWSWKVADTYGDIDERSRDGDDFPARLYVVVKTGLLPWQTLAINYVWSSHTAVGESWPNPFTKKAYMVVVQTGEAEVGTWVRQERNVAEDFKTYFNQDITNIDGYAVMVDGDNSGSSGTAWFGQISFAAE